MTQHFLPRVARAAFGFSAFAAAPALAQGVGPDGGFGIEATATIVSDYRFRGVSLSDRDPAAQGSIDLSYRGFYAGVWVSSIARYADSNVEADVYAGYAGEAGGVSYEVGAIAYLYPGGDGSGDVFEATAALSYNIGPATGRLRANYAPDQAHLAGDNLYLSADARFAVPGTPVTLFAQFGGERGSFYGRKLDWSLGAEATHGPVTISFGYFDTDLNGVASGLGRNVGSGVVATAGLSF